jgi:decaprenylphospho-beta-D-ribofuranose 2-oxidase
MHPLDGVGQWNSLYGRKGFIQYQFVIPFESSEVLQKVINRMQEYKCSSFLTVLKSLGQSSKGYLSFPMSGWTLAIDIPVENPRTSTMLRELDKLIIKAGGRIYLTKDSRLNPNHLGSMYHQLEDWKRIKRNADPENIWQSDQSRRLKLC